MRTTPLAAFRHHGLWLLVWCVLSLAGAALVGRSELARQQSTFETDARITHRLLSQRVVQHDAILATLALLQPATDASAPERRLPALYSQILAVERRDGGAPWAVPALDTAETLSRALRRPALAGLDLAAGRFWLVLAAEPASFALQMDLKAVVPWAEWPMAADTSPVRVTLEHASQTFVVQPGRMRAGGWQYDFRKPLASDSQPFDVVATRRIGWGELPWLTMAVQAVILAGVLAGLRTVLRQREQRRRAEELLRLGQVARLNAMGELAAGMAHEINQPLTALLASTQACGRLLDDEPPDLPLARVAAEQAARQARRAADVVGRLRRTVEQPDLRAPLRPVDLRQSVRAALHLLAPELQARQIRTDMEAAGAPVTVLADAVALEQIVHNLLVNALQALEQVPQGQRALVLSVGESGGTGALTVRDTGPGVAAEALPRLFEPFFTTRPGGLGLGLNLCETLAGRMGGQLTAANHPSRGAVFTLTLPLATPLGDGAAHALNTH